MAAPRRDPFDLAGSLIDGRYRVVSVVGEGGFGVVYRGVHEGFDSPVAIKCLKLPPHLEPADEAALVASLRDEGRLLRRLSQRTAGIVQAHDVGSLEPRGMALSAGGRALRVPYLVLEWLDGHTLADELRARGEASARMPVGEAIAMLAPAARALAVAHSENVAHRDIKPENLFLAKVGGAVTLKILDFGIAKVFSEAPSAADAQTGLGPRAFTPAYGAPEQFDKRRGATGPWTDVYALALVLVEMASGRRAQEGDDFASLFTASTDPGRRPTLRSSGVAVSDEVERVVQRALAVEPAERYPDAGAFWDALEAARAGDAARIEDAHDGGVEALAGTQLAPGGADVPTGEFAAARGLAVGGEARPEAAANGGVASPSSGVASPSSGVATTSAGVAATSKESAPSARAGSAAAPALRRWGALAAGAVAAAVALTVWWFTGGKAGTGSGAAPGEGLSAALPGSGSAPAGAVSGAALGESHVPEAQAQFKDAMQAWLDGTLEIAVRAMEKAVALDPGFGAAELRLALWKFDRKPTEARDHFQSAQLHRGSLSPRDQGLLHASEAYLREPWDLAEWTARVEALVAASPADVELLIFLGLSNHVRLRLDAAVEAFDKALAQNPGLVGAWVLKADSLSLKGDNAAQLAAYEACLKTAPMASQCLSRLVVLRGRTGQCEAMREDAKRLLSISSKSPATQRQLAVALFATGAPRDAVLEALARGWGLAPDDERAGREAADRSQLAMAEGDFPAAERALLGWAAAVKDKTNQTHHAEPALALAQLHEETGDAKKAGAVAEAFARRMGALSEPTAGDWAMAFLPYRLRAGLLPVDVYTRERAAWAERLRAKWKTGGRKVDEEFEWIAWLNAYGNVVRTEADAKEALAAMPSRPSIAVESGRWTAMDLGVGRAQVLAGDAAKALGPLARASRSCLALTEPTLPAQVDLYLGMALEKTGDLAGARAAYGRVLARWGAAKPRSVTAAKAKERLGKLPASK